jgi:hypothetical protein
MRKAIWLLLTTAFWCCIALSGIAYGEDMYIEGYVFQPTRSEPIRNVEISVWAEGVRETVATTVTDINGFYQVRISDPASLYSETLFVQATCHLRNQFGEFVLTLGTGIEAAPIWEHTVVRRDIYFDRTWRSAFRKRHGCGPDPGEQPMRPLGDLELPSQSEPDGNQ